jgi:hypothetical protein
MDNVALAMTSLMCLWPLQKAYQQGEVVTFQSIGVVGLLSFFSHLLQSHQHNMSGFGCPEMVSRFLNCADVMSAIWLELRLLWILPRKTIRKYAVHLILCFSANLFAEYSESTHEYVILHGYWHIAIFACMAGMLGDLYA